MLNVEWEIKPRLPSKASEVTNRSRTHGLARRDTATVYLTALKLGFVEYCLGQLLEVAVPKTVQRKKDPCGPPRFKILAEGCDPQSP